MPAWLTAALGIVSGAISLTNKAVSDFIKRGDQKTGAEIQEAKDGQASQQAGMDRARIDVAVGAMSSDDLDRVLRGPNGKTGS